MLNQQLQSLKKSSGKTNKEISLITGIPESTISKIISGETANPLFLNVADIVKAMDASLDEITGISKPKEKDFLNPLIEHYERDLIHERKLNKMLLIALFVIIAFLISILLIDVSNGGIGFIRY